MPLYKDPSYKNNFLSCYHCGSYDLHHVKPFSVQHHDIFVDNPSFSKIYNDQFPHDNPYESNILECPNCFDHWRMENEDPDSNEYYSNDIIGLAPARLMDSNSKKNVNELPFESACNYPHTCSCGQCPDPNQLQFNLKGASFKYAVVKPGLDDYWDEDPNETNIQNGQPSVNWYDGWNTVPTYINDEVGRDIEQNSGRAPTGVGDFNQSYRVFNNPSYKQKQVEEINKRRQKYPDHFNINEISNLLGVSRTTIQDRIKNGAFPKPDVKGTTTFKGDKGNLPAIWHRDTIKHLIDLPEKKYIERQTSKDDDDYEDDSRFEGRRI